MLEQAVVTLPPALRALSRLPSLHPIPVLFLCCCAITSLNRKCRPGGRESGGKVYSWMCLLDERRLETTSPVSTALAYGVGQFSPSVLQCVESV